LPVPALPSRSTDATVTTQLQRQREEAGDALTARAVYYVAMSFRHLLEGTVPSDDEDVQPLYPEPEIELDVDTLE
jgi:hypothetical protein